MNKKSSWKQWWTGIILGVFVLGDSAVLAGLTEGANWLSADLVTGKLVSVRKVNDVNQIKTSELRILEGIRPELTETHSEEVKKNLEEQKNSEDEVVKEAAAKIVENLSKRSQSDAKKVTEEIQKKGEVALDEEVVTSEGWEIKKSLNVLDEAGVIDVFEDHKTGEIKVADPELIEHAIKKGKLTAAETEFEAEISESAKGTMKLSLEVPEETQEKILKEENKEVKLGEKVEEILPQTVIEIAEDKLDVSVEYFPFFAEEREGVIVENKIVYGEVWEGVDLMNTVTSQGIKEDIIIKNEEAPTEFLYAVSLKNLRPRIVDGIVEYIDPTGEKRMWIPTPKIWGANGVEGTAEYKMLSEDEAEIWLNENNPIKNQIDYLEFDEETEEWVPVKLDKVEISEKEIFEEGEAEVEKIKLPGMILEEEDESESETETDESEICEMEFETGTGSEVITETGSEVLEPETGTGEEVIENESEAILDDQNPEEEILEEIETETGSDVLEEKVITETGSEVLEEVEGEAEITEEPETVIENEEESFEGMGGEAEVKDAVIEEVEVETEETEEDGFVAWARSSSRFLWSAILGTNEEGTGSEILAETGSDVLEEVITETGSDVLESETGTGEEAIENESEAILDDQNPEEEILEEIETETETGSDVLEEVITETGSEVLEPEVEIIIIDDLESETGTGEEVIENESEAILDDQNPEEEIEFETGSDVLEEKVITETGSEVLEEEIEIVVEGGLEPITETGTEAIDFEELLEEVEKQEEIQEEVIEKTEEEKAGLRKEVRTAVEDELPPEMIRKLDGVIYLLLSVPEDVLEEMQYPLDLDPTTFVVGWDSNTEINMSGFAWGEGSGYLSLADTQTGSVAVTFTTEGNYDQEDVKGTITNWVPTGTGSSGYFTDGSEAVSLGGDQGNDSYVKLLLHMDGVNDGTTFTDSSASAKTVTGVNALTKTATKKFGTASGYFDGTGDYLTVADSDDWDFGSGSFTIDGWINFDSGVTDASIVSHANPADRSFGLNIISSNINFIASNTTDGANNNNTISLVGNTTVSTGWNHIAVVRSGNLISIYLNGTSIGSTTNSLILRNSAAVLRVGIYNHTSGLIWPMNGYLDEIRISKGVARWTSNFTPPVAPYGDGDETKVVVGARAEIGGDFYDLDKIEGGVVDLDSQAGTGSVSAIYGTKISGGSLLLNSGSGGTIVPVDNFYTVVTNTGAELDSSTWSDLNDVTVTESLNGEDAFYSVSFDGGLTWKVWSGTGWRAIASNDYRETGFTSVNLSKWGYRDGGSTWNLASSTGSDSATSAISQAMAASVNRMSGSTIMGLASDDWKDEEGWSIGTDSIRIAVSLRSVDESYNPAVSDVAFEKDLKYGLVLNEDFLTGYMWGESAGWIHVGTGSGVAYDLSGGQTNLTYGVNVDTQDDDTRCLSGYGWGENAGWVSFGSGGVTIGENDPALGIPYCSQDDLNGSGSTAFFDVDGQLHGYAWGENVGWIRMDYEVGEPVAAGTGVAITGSALTDNLGYLNFDGTGEVILNASYLSGYGWLDNDGWVHFGTGNEAPYPVFSLQGTGSYGINVALTSGKYCLSGKAFGNEVGWVSFGSGGVGIGETDSDLDIAYCSEAALDGGLKSTAFINENGDLKGYAWNELTGWINMDFDPNEATTKGFVGVTGYAWAENGGYLSFAGDTEDGVKLYDGFMSGYGWWERLGYLHFGTAANALYPSPALQGTGSYGVLVNSVGGYYCLSGKAWGENSGWVNFGSGGVGTGETDPDLGIAYCSPDDAGGNGSTVFIDAAGDFYGNAWGEKVGWISMNTDVNEIVRQVILGPHSSNPVYESTPFSSTGVTLSTYTTTPLNLSGMAALYTDDTIYGVTEGDIVSGSGSVTFADESNYLQEDVKGEITNWVQDSGAAGHFENGTGESVTLVSVNPLDAETKLLLHMDNGDDSVSEKTVTFNGNPQASAGTGKFAGSMYFDGSGDYIQTSVDSDFVFGTDDFTVDFWVNLDSIQGDLEAMEIRNTMIGISSGLHGNGVWSIFYGGDGTAGDNRLRFVADIDTFELTSSPGVISENQWYHVALTRSSGTMRLFLDGEVLVSSSTPVDLDGSGLPVTIGINTVYTDNTRDLNGYMDEVRISKGIARWTSNFTPPTSSYTSPDSNTKLLLHMDNGDESASGNTVTFNGNSQAYGTGKFAGSMYFDGTDYLSIADSIDWDFRTDAFTIDAWINPSSITINYHVIIGRSSAVGTTAYTLLLSSVDGIGFYGGGANFYEGDGSGWITGQWYHVAVVRDGDNFYLFRNGTLVTQSTGSGDIDTDYELWVGAFQYGHAAYPYFNGYMDEVRVSKGIARWTSNFTPPTSPYESGLGEGSAIVAGTRINIGGNFYDLDEIIQSGDGSGEVVLSDAVTSGSVNMVYGTAFSGGSVTLNSGSGGTIVPVDNFYTVVTETGARVDADGWTGISTGEVTESLTDGEAYYSLSFDGGDEWKIWNESVWRTIASNKNSTTGLTEGSWGYVDSGSVWTLASTNGTDTAQSAISQAMTYTENQMTGSGLSAISNSNWGASGGWSDAVTGIDVAVTLKATSSSAELEVSEVTFNYLGVVRYAAQLFTFGVSAYEGISELVPQMIAYAIAPDGNGIAAKIWDANASDWVGLNELTNTASSMPGSASTQTISSNISNYIDNGIVRILLSSTNPASSSTGAILYTDLMKLELQYVTAAAGTIDGMVPVIEKDTFLPTGSISVDSVTTDTTPILTLSAADVGIGMTDGSMKFSCDNASWTTAVDYVTSYTGFDITTEANGCSADDGDRVIYVKFIDGATNESISYTGAVSLDALGPTTPVVTDEGIITKTGSQLIASWSATDSGSSVTLYQYCISTDTTDCATGQLIGWTGNGTGTSVTGTGLSLVEDTTYYWHVKAQDENGNWSSEGHSDGITYIADVAPNAPVRYSPGDNLATNSFTVELSALYSDDNLYDTGVTNYRVATSTGGCLDEGTVVSSGASAETETNSGATTWTSGSLSDGVYYWCAQNDDGESQSAWTSMGTFEVDLINPQIIITDNANSSWNQSDDIIATISNTGSALNYLGYTFDSDGTCPNGSGNYATSYTSGSTITVNSNHNDYICFWAEDVAGNTGSAVTDQLKVNTDIPDIVALDAGASSADRTSLTSGTWFGTGAIGGDDQISLSWTDPGSVSDDTFYYCLDETAGTGSIATDGGCEGGLDSNTKLLLSMDNGDDSASGHTVTFNGDPQASAGTGKFAGSMYFDGSGDYLSLEDSDDWNFGTGDFAIDFWFYPTKNSTYQALFHQGEGADYFNLSAIEYDASNNRLRWVLRSASVDFFDLYTSGVSPTLNAWNHVAAVRNGSTFTVYINGTAGNSTTTALAYPDIPYIVRIGDRYVTGSAAHEYFQGYIDEVRISKGTARWTSNFTPPTEPYTSPDSNTKLLLSMDNGDESASGNTVTFNGDSQASAGTGKFAGSMYFDGSGDYLSVADSDDFSFGTGDFTIDFWVKPTTNNEVGRDIISKRPSSSFGPFLLYQYGSIFYFYASSDGANWDISSGGKSLGSVDLNTWTHLAVTREGNTFYTYKNGELQTSFSSSASLVSNAIPINFGSDNGGSTYFTGYIDEARISKDIARWTSNFTPPTNPYGNALLSGSTSNPYVDDVTISEGTTYMHAKPQNGVGTWGDERVFEINYQSDLQQITITDDANGTWGTGDTVAATAWTEPFGLNYMLYDFDADGICDSASGSYANSYTSGDTISITTDHNDYVCFWAIDNGGNIGTGATAQLKVEVSAPDIVAIDAGASSADRTSLTSGNWFGSGAIGGDDQISLSWTDPESGSDDTFYYCLDETAGTGSIGTDGGCGVSGLDSDTKLLLSMDSLDESASGHEITYNGNPQSYGTGKFAGSMYFDGSGDNLSLADSDDWYFGTDAFTIDAWIYLESVDDRDGVFFDYSSYTNGSENSVFWYMYSGRIAYRLNASGIGDAQLASTTLSINTWYHVAWVGDGTTIKMYLNGVEDGTATQGNIADFSQEAIIGQIYHGNSVSWGDFDGYIDELRISKGIQRWTSNFTPPTEPYTSPDSNTKLLLHMDNGDESASGHTVTFNGNPQASAGTGKFAGSMYFDGTGDYLSVADSDDFSFGTGSFTIDFWMNPSNVTSDVTAISQWQRSTEASQAWVYGWSSVNSQSFFVMEDASDTQYVRIENTGTVFQQSQWYHVAIVKDGESSVTIYVNGIAEGIDTSVTGTIKSVSQELFIGAQENSTTGTSYQDFNGYLDEIRISKGVARWTSNFTPPTSPYGEGGALLSGSTSNPYVDDVTISEGTTYMHAKPQNGLGTWGDERVFEINYEIDYLNVSIADNANGTWGTSDTVAANIEGTTTAVKWDFDADGVCPITSGSYTYDYVSGSGISITTDHNDYVCFYAEDSATGNTGSAVTDQLKVDVTIPTVSDDYSYDNTWVTSNQTITLTPTDALSGISYTNYCWGSACDPIVDGSSGAVISIITDTNNTLKYQTVDQAGNQSATGSVIVKVDKVVPQISITDDAIGSWVASDIIIATGADDVSGLNYMLYDFDADGVCDSASGSYANSYTSGAEINITTDHSDYICFWALDNAGNIGTGVTAQLKVEPSTPDIVAIDAGASSADRTSLTSGTWFGTGAIGGDDQISLSWTDPESVSDDTFYYVYNLTGADSINSDAGQASGSVATNYLDDFTILEGIYYLHVQPKNELNWGTERTFEIKYDKTGPSVSISSVVADSVSQITVTANTANDGEGIGGSYDYNFYRYTGTGCTGEPVISDWQSADDTVHSFGTLDSNTAYSVKVVARDTLNIAGDFSACSDVYTLASQVDSLNAIGGYDVTNNYKVDLTWVDQGQSGMKIERDVDCDGSYESTIYDFSGVSATSPWTNSGVDANTCYQYRVSSYNGDGILNEGSQATAFDTTPPAAPIGLTHTGNTITSISFDWDDVTAAGYYKFYSSADSYVSVMGTGSVSAWLKSGMSSNTQYCLKVSAANTEGEGAKSNEYCAYASANVPTSASHDAITTSGVTWSWMSGGAERDFYAWMDVPSDNSGWQTETTWNKSSGLSENRNYSFNVKARNEDLEETTSVSASAYTAISDPDGAPVLTASASDTILVEANGTFANISTGSTGLYFLNTTTSGTSGWVQSENWNNSSLTPNTSYSYIFKARNGDSEETVLSATGSIYTLANVPSTPTVGAPKTATGLTVTINANSNPSGTNYQIYYGTGSTGNPTTNPELWIQGQDWTGYDDGDTISHGNLNPNTTYYYMMRARNEDLEVTSWSSIGSAYTLSAEPDITEANSHVILNWYGSGTSFAFHNNETEVSYYKYFWNTTSEGEFIDENLDSCSEGNEWLDVGSDLNLGEPDNSGQYTFHVLSCNSNDEAGALSHYGEYYFDGDVPTVSDDYGSDGVWEVTSQTVNLNPGDTGGSGVIYTKYCWGSACDPISGSSGTSIIVSTYTDDTLRYQTVDQAGNQSTTGSIAIKVDLDAPQIIITDNANSSWNQSDDIIATISNTGSALNYLGYTFDSDGTCPNGSGNYATSYTSGSTITVNSNHNDYICFWVEDIAGNTGSAVTDQLFVDVTIPTVSDDYSYDNTWVTSNQTITLTPTDALSGISYTNYCWGSACDPIVDGSSGAVISIITDTNNTLKYQTVDQAGNQSATGSVIVKVDKTAPTGGSVSYYSGYQAVTGIEVTVNAGSDDVSGMSQTNSDYVLEYKSATLSGSVCGTFSDWVDAGVSETTSATSYNFTGVNGNCYQFRYTVENIAGLTATWTDEAITRIDTDIPDIVALDAGASSADRTSLTSGTWFGTGAIGGDDQISLSWTDPGSVSGDTFYYELNSDSGSTVIGDESSTTNPYVDDIVVSEGISYFHVRPQNGVAVWGSERVFVLQYDKTAPQIVFINNASGAWVLSETVVANITESYLKTAKWDYDTDGVCSTTSVDYGNDYISGNEINVTSNHNDYICFYAEDEVGLKVVAATEQLKVDVTNPTVSDDYANDGSWVTSNQTITLSPDDNYSVAYTMYCWGADCNPASGTSGTSVIINTDTNDTLRYQTWDAAGNESATGSVAVKVDKTEPTGGSISYYSGLQASINIEVAVDPGSDDISEMSDSNSDYLLESSSADLVAGVCDSFLTWADAGVSETASATGYQIIGVDGNCYKFRYTVTNKAGLTTVYTSDQIVQINSTVPDVVAIDAGASSADRTSLTSGTWFGSGAIGGDDQISLSWTDPESTTDDTFYYELNTNSGSTISGDESSTANPWVDDVTISEGISWFHVRPQNGGGTWGSERVFVIQFDKTSPNMEAGLITAPTNGEILNGGEVKLITWDEGAITDTGSGILENSSIKAEFFTSGSGWTVIAENQANSGSLAWTVFDESVSGVKVRLTAWDQVGNEVNQEMTGEFEVVASDDFTVLQKVSGDKQVAGLNEFVENEMVVRVENSLGNLAGAGDVNVTFEIQNVPGSPTGTGQNLIGGVNGQNASGSGTETLIVETDANGLAGAKIQLGDRAGDYQIRVSFGDGTLSKSGSFVMTELPVWNLSLSGTGVNLTDDPGIGLGSSGSVTATVITNAASWNLGALPGSWLVNSEQSGENVGNWNGTLGFGWTSSSQENVTAFQTSAGNPALTTVHSCSGTGCAGTTQVQMNLHELVDHTDMSGTFSNQMKIKGMNVEF